VTHLREAGARVDTFVACALGDLGTVRRLLKKSPEDATGRDPGGLTALQCCAATRLFKGDLRARRRLLEIATLLLDSGADPNAKTKSWSHEIDAAYLAVSARNAEMLELLLARGGDATAALPAAAWCDDKEFAEIALRHGGSLNRASEGARPLLNELVRWGQVSAVLWLLQRGADPNLPDEKGWTAVHQAASRGNARMLKALLDAGGDPLRQDRFGMTPGEVARGKRILGLAKQLVMKR
jgi:ankyrin repeat protein